MMSKNLRVLLGEYVVRESDHCYLENLHYARKTSPAECSPDHERRVDQQVAATGAQSLADLFPPSRLLYVHVARPVHMYSASSFLPRVEFLCLCDDVTPLSTF